MIIKLQNGDKIEKGLFGWISKIKDRMYRTITPRGYHIRQAAKEFIKGDTRDMSKFTPLENEVWARYLGTKYKGPSNLEPAIYRPTKGGATYNDVVKLKDESLILSNDVLKLLLDNYKKTGKKSMLVEGNESGLGTYTISMGEDEKGKYISYYDDWDINPTRGISAKYNIPILNLIGDIVPGTHPFSVYGRRYYKNGGLIRKMLTASGGPIHYSRTMDTDNLSKATNYVGKYVLKGLGALGKFLNAGFTSPTYGTIGQVSYARNAKDAKRLRELSEASEQALGKAMTWASPLNYGAALWNGHGLNARKGEEEVASWSPAWLAVGRIGELYVGPKGAKAVKNLPKAAVDVAAKAGVKPAKAAVVAREINKGIKLNTKNGRIEVTENYFNAPDKWYRVSETPEKFGIREQGKNITTTDSPQTKGTIDRFRRKIIKKHKTEDGQNFILVPGKGINEGYFVRLPVRFSLSKNGAAHGNTSQAAARQIWQGTFARSGRFPEGIIEGQAPSKIYRGMLPDGTDSRTNFILQDWENVPKGARVGFHTGEMPMSNLGWFLKTNRGTYTYEPIISEKRITKVGDVEINNPLLAYRQGKGIAEDFIKKGEVEAKPEPEKVLSPDSRGWTWDFTPQHFDRPMFAQGRPWFGYKGGGGGDLLVTAEPLSLGNANGGLVPWEGNRTFDVRYELGRLRSPVGIRRVPAEGQVLDTSNTTAYKWVPEYGYKLVVREPSTSLAFFERKPSKINEAERAGVPKGERNFEPKWHVANYPGYLLKGLMKGSLLEKQLSKNGTININQLNTYFNKASQIEKDVVNKVLNEQFAGLKIIDYNKFKKAILNELITYTIKPQTKYSAYGMDRLGINVLKEPDGAGGIIEYSPGIKTNTFTFESPKIPVGNSKHYDASTLGHSRTYTTPEESRVLHVMESQSDWGLTKLGNNSAPYTGTTKYLNDPTAYRKFIDGHKRLLAEMLANPSDYLVGAIERQIANIEHHEAILKLMLAQKGLSPLAKYLHDNYLLRQLQENLKFAAENGLAKMRYPTSKTAAKIEGYSKTEQTPEYKEALTELERLQGLKTTNLMSRAERVLGIREAIENNRLISIPDEINIETGEIKYYTPEEKAKLIRDAENKLADILILLRDFMYSPLHQTILKKYADFPKLFLKLFKDLQVRTVVDAKGNTWYEVDVPKGYLSREWQFKQGGKMNILELFKNGGQIRKMQTASGGPIINGGTPFSITVKGKDRRPAWKRMYQNPNLGDTSEYYNGNILEDVIGLAPGIGDVIDAVKAADAVNNKDYTTAGFLGAGLLLPNIVEKPLKFARGLYKGYKANKIMKAAKKALDESGEKLEVDAFKSGSKPMYVTPAKGPGSNHINAISDELKDSKYLDLERPFGKDGTLTLRYYINEGKLKQTIGAYKDLYKDRLGLHTNDVDKIYNHMISNPKLLDLNVNPGTTGLLDIIGVSLGYGPKDAILFKIGYSGLNTGEKVSKEAIESMKTYGYDRTLPGIYNILKKNIERGTLGVKSTNTNGGHVGFGYIKNRLGGRLQLLKNGSGIHIKEKNKGKFTAYCGGNVTSACIAKAKASGNPTLVKRATFAANARKWKHANGGTINPMIIDYIKAIENPDKIGWDGKVWRAPKLRGYDLNLRGYGIDINTNKSAKELTKGRSGLWMTNDEADTLMRDHILYITLAANKHIKGFNKLSTLRQAALLGMLYRGDSVNKSNINITEPDDDKFFSAVHNYYINKGLKERANNSAKFFSKKPVNTMFNFNNYKDLNYPFNFFWKKGGRK